MDEKVRCNGAGEMPGEEGKDSTQENYTWFLEHKKDDIIEKWAAFIVDNGELGEVPDWFIDSRFEEWCDDQ